jgi:hypothetical protein
MDIAFHYFAIKSLAVTAGFSDEDAQTIAGYSQMAGDFDFAAYWNCTIELPACLPWAGGYPRKSQGKLPGFLAGISGDSGESAKVKHLQQVWNVPHCTYSYNSAEIKKGFEKESASLNVAELLPVNSTRSSADFYTFNVIADEVLIALYGDHPRRL